MSDDRKKRSFDPKERAAWKEALRREDMAAIASGVPPKEVARRNSAFASLDLRKARIIKFPE